MESIGGNLHQKVHATYLNGRFYPLSVPYKIIQRRTLPKKVIEVHTLEEIQKGLLNGRISKHDGLLHPDLTGDEIIEIRNIGDFHSVLLSNDFWLQSRLQNSAKDIPFFTIVLILFFLFAFLLLAEEILMNNALHWSYIIWDKKWWSPIISGFLHVDLRHLCINILFFA